MKRALVYFGSLSEGEKPLVYDISTTAARDNAYGRLFKALVADTSSPFYKRIDMDNSAQQLYAMAQRGNDTIARAFMLLFQEALSFAEVDVVEAPEPKLAVVVDPIAVGNAAANNGAVDG